MSVTIKIRRGTATQWSSGNPVLSEGELGLETDTGLVKAGDGISHWNTLPYLPAHNHADPTYTWDQAAASATWTINHNLGRFLNVTVVTTTGTQVEGDVVFQDGNTIVVQFSSAFSGKAFLS